MFEIGDLVYVKDTSHKFYNELCCVEAINCLNGNMIAIWSNVNKHSLFIHPDGIEVELKVFK